VRPRGEKCVGDLEMRRSRSHDADRIDLAEQLAVVGYRRRIHLAGNLAANIVTSIDDRDQFAGV
jgi:hypothetical protein